MEATELTELAQGLSDLLGLGLVSRLEPVELQENERGWSGAKLIRQRVIFTDSTSTTMIFKHTERKERHAMQRLTGQRQCTPASYSPASRETGWMAMEDLGHPRIASPCDRVWLEKVAEGLASIHAANLEKGSEMPWLPVADDAYWHSVITRLSVDHFRRKMEQDPGFSHEFGKYLPRLEEAAVQFEKDMCALSRESGCLTLTHGDLQTQDGAHIYACGGKPRIIDFGFCRYAPLYIDLAGWFTAEELPIYYDALTAKGFSLPYGEFEERSRAAFRYNGFIYLYPSIMDWQNGPTERTGKRLLQALYIIMTGDFPERRRDYSGGLFSRLLGEHQQVR